uniref:Telomere length regulation protein conserved domain-containing protein n=1 Tax=Setaria digitata TaxID=48799 RepID=A0A915PJQ9_9BILA
MCDEGWIDLGSARSRSELLTALQKALKLLFAVKFQYISSGESSSFVKYRILTQLVNIFHPSTLGLLTANEFKELFAELFRSAPVDDAFFVLVNALHSCDSSQIFRLQHIIILLDDLEKTRLETLLVESIGKDPNDVEWNVKQGELCRLLGQTTCLVHNAAGDSHLSGLVKSIDVLLESYLNNHWLYLLNSIKAALMNAVTRCRNAKDVNIKLIAGITYELSSGDVLAFRSLLGWLASQGEDGIWNRINKRLLVDTSNGIAHLESLLIVVLLAANNGEMLQKLFGNEIYENRVVKRIFFEKALFVKVFPPNEKVPEKLAVCLHFGSSKGAWSTLHQDTLCIALNIWSSSIHISHSSDEQLDYVDVVLLNLGKYAKRVFEQIRRNISTEVVTAMAAGVSLRLRCSDIRRRVRGMFIAEVFTSWFSLGELKFEFPPETDEIAADLAKIVDEECAVGLVANGNGSEEKKVMELEIQDLRNGIEEVDSDDDDFPKYEIPAEELILKKEEDSEDYRSVEAPCYIRDCIEGLNEQNDYAKFEAAFNTLNSMIRRRAVGYEQSAEELLCRLIDLNDCFKTERFQEKRLELIESCLVTSPHLGSVAVDIMFSRRCSMMNRYIILKALSDAAYEYSSASPLVQNLDTRIQKCESNKISSGGDVACKTKLYGKAPVMALKENRFTPVANSFFYPLTAINQYREHLDLIGKDSELLSRILFCMSHLIKCSGSSPCTVRMVSTLAHLLIPLRHNDNFAVRKGVLFCYASICMSLSKEVILYFYSEELADWFGYATKLGEADPSTECRQMAQVAAQAVAGVIFGNE